MSTATASTAGFTARFPFFLRCKTEVFKRYLSPILSCNLIVLRSARIFHPKGCKLFMTKKAGCFYPQQRGDPPPIQRRSRWRRLDAHGFYPQQRVSGSAVPAACRRRRDWLPMGRPGIAPAAGRRHSHAMSWRISPARGGPDSPPPAAPLDRRKGLPPADDKVFKDLQSLLQRLFLKSLAFHPAVRYNKTTRRGKAFTSRIFLTALSLRKGAKAIRTAGSNAEHGNFVALLNFYKLAD